MKKLYDLAVVTRKYQSNGQDKSVWENIGSVLQGENGPYMMLKAHFNPAAINRREGSDCITVSMFKPKEKDSSAQDSYSSQDFSSVPNDDIPF